MTHQDHSRSFSRLQTDLGNFSGTVRYDSSHFQTCTARKPCLRKPSLGKPCFVLQVVTSLPSLEWHCWALVTHQGCKNRCTRHDSAVGLDRQSVFNMAANNSQPARSSASRNCTAFCHLSSASQKSRADKMSRRNVLSKSLYHMGNAQSIARCNTCSPIRLSNATHCKLLIDI